MTEPRRLTEEARRPVPMYLYRPEDHGPLDAEQLAWLADQLCSETRVHPDRTMAIGWITTQAAYELPALVDALAARDAEIAALREALENAVSVLCSVRKNYEDGSLLWEDVSRFISEGNAALTTIREPQHD